MAGRHPIRLPARVRVADMDQTPAFRAAMSVGVVLGLLLFAHYSVATDLLPARLNANNPGAFQYFSPEMASPPGAYPEDHAPARD